MVWESHLYFLTGVAKLALAKKTHSGITTIPDAKLKKHQYTRTEAHTELHPWPGVDAMEPGGQYSTTEIEEVRNELLRSRRSPKVSLVGRLTRKLTYNFSSLDGKKGSCVIWSRSEDALAICSSIAKNRFRMLSSVFRRFSPTACCRRT